MRGRCHVCGYWSADEHLPCPRCASPRATIQDWDGAELSTAVGTGLGTGAGSAASVEDAEYIRELAPELEPDPPRDAWAPGHELTPGRSDGEEDEPEFSALAGSSFDESFAAESAVGEVYFDEEADAIAAEPARDADAEDDDLSLVSRWQERLRARISRARLARAGMPRLSREFAAGFATAALLFGGFLTGRALFASDAAPAPEPAATAPASDVQDGAANARAGNGADAAAVAGALARVPTAHVAPKHVRHTRARTHKTHKTHKARTRRHPASKHASRHRHTRRR